MQQACLAYGLTPLLDHAPLSIERSERLCVVGRNGAGKSTLLKVIAGSLELDSGQINIDPDVTVSYMPQDPPKTSEESVFDYVAQGLADIGQLLVDYHHIVQQLSQGNDTPEVLEAMTKCQVQLDHHQGWQLNTRVEQILTRLDLDGEQVLKNLSGGWLRRVALAKALVVEPDILLLDEPTNHIDIDMVQWLENFLLDFSGALVFISHDRQFIRRLATRIIDLDRGQITSWPGDYDTYLVGKKEALDTEEKQNALFDKRLSEEERWIRQGIKARRTRNEGRVRELKAMRAQRRQRLSHQGNAKIAIAQQETSGKIVFEGQGVGFAVPGKTLIKDFDFSLMRGDRIALVGPNGCGKSTLIHLLLDQLKPTQGYIQRGTKLDVAYFDQKRAQLDENKTVMENVGQGAQDVEVNGKKRHIIGYLQDYLFDPARARTPVSSLSGGEKNRLLLAKLFLKPSNLLILDEPTNDLDVETLELLEEKIADYAGTILLVSHDRVFIDQTATGCWWFMGDSKIEQVVGGFTENVDYIAQKKQQKMPSKSVTMTPSKSPKCAQSAVKMTYQMQKELAGLPQVIEKLEAQLSVLQRQVSEPAFFNQSVEQTQPVLKQLAQIESELEQAFARWETLESIANQQ